jgi:hypothetical protein
VQAMREFSAVRESTAIARQFPLNCPTPSAGGEGQPPRRHGRLRNGRIDRPESDPDESR